MHKTNFKKLAKTLIKKYGTDNPFKIAEHQGIKIIYSDFSSWLGLYTCIGNEKTIFINIKLPYLSKRISCIYIYENEKLLSGTSQIEHEANEFAATLIFNNKDIYNYDLTELDRKLLKKLEKYL